MTLNEAKSDKGVKIITVKKTVTVTLTEKHPGFGKKKTATIPEHMVEHLLKKGMIESPKGKKSE